MTIASLWYDQLKDSHDGPPEPAGNGFRESGGPRLCRDVDAEGQSDLLGNPLAAPGAIAPFHFNELRLAKIPNQHNVAR